MNVYDFLRGVTSCRVTCGCPERFINALRKRVSVIDLEKTEEFCISVSFYTSSRRAFDDCCKEFGAEIKMQRVFGLSYVAALCKRRPGIVLGSILCIAIIFCSSLFVWEIRVEGNEKIDDTYIISMLEGLGFKEGVLKSSVDQKALKNLVLMREHNISWFAVNFDGMTAKVLIKEAMRPKTEENLTRKANIIAKSDAQIIRVDALDGDAVVQKDEYVTKGQLLISALVETRHSGALLRSAKGSVWGKTIRKFSVTVPLEYSKKVYTGNKHKHRILQMLGGHIKIPDIHTCRFEMSDTKNKTEKITLLNTFVLPVKLHTKSCIEYTVISKKRTASEAEEYAKKVLSRHIEKQLGNCPVSNKKIQNKTDSNSVTLICELECIENIAEYLDFEK